MSLLLLLLPLLLVLLPQLLFFNFLI